VCHSFLIIDREEERKRERERGEDRVGWGGEKRVPPIEIIRIAGARSN